jgi:glycosyltransferase involved in cell wall biosynthesis
MLIVGQLGYHEKNIILPLIEEIKEEYEIDRLGGNFDFFVPSNYPNLIQNYFSAIPNSLKDYDVVFFVDFWNMILPMFVWKKSIENPSCRLVGIYHGSTEFENDVACEIPNAKKYEEYLLSSYDSIFVHFDWIKDLHKTSDNLIVATYPVSEQMNRVRPNLPSSKTVYFIHRFHEDKGVNSFLAFVESCSEKVNFVVFDSMPVGFNNEKYKIKFTGRVSQEEIKYIVSTGGYTWSSAKSEIVSYGMLDLVSYGLTPIVNNHPAYQIFPRKFRYSSIEEAKVKIENDLRYSETDWNELISYYKKSYKISDSLLGR